MSFRDFPINETPRNAAFSFLHARATPLAGHPYRW